MRLNAIRRNLLLTCPSDDTELPTNATTSIREDLATLFLTASQAVERRLAELGLPLTQPDFRTTIRRSSPGNWGSSREEYAANILAVDAIIIRGAPWLNAAEAAAVFAVSARLDKSAQATLPYLAFLGGRVWPLIEPLADRPEVPTYEQNPSDWVARALVMPALLWHLEHLSSVDVADQSEPMRSPMRC
jgi:hypothetical protein